MEDRTPQIVSANTIRNHFTELGIPEKTTSKFLAAHKATPQLWKEFERRCLEHCESGVWKIFAKGIMEDIRRDASINLGASGYKVQNSLTSYYVRTFCFKYPWFAHRFDRRPIRGIQSLEKGGKGEKNLFD